MHQLSLNNTQGDYLVHSISLTYFLAPIIPVTTSIKKPVNRKIESRNKLQERLLIHVSNK